jgi:hypothetical protein
MKTSGSLSPSAYVAAKAHSFIRRPFFKILFLSLLPLAICAQTTTIYKETVGNYSGSIGILLYTGWSTPSVMHAATGAISVTNLIPSSNYAGASGGSPINITSGSSWTISNINTSVSTNIKLSFGIHKSNKLETAAALVVEVSSNGTTYTPLTKTDLPTGNGTGNSWFYRTGGVDITGSIPAASNLRVRFRNTGAVDYGLDDIELTSTIALPLHLLEFNARKETNRTEVSWTTADEQNVNHFELQRSENGSSFNTIQTIKARNSGRTEMYNASDITFTSKTFYRLMSVDNDAKTVYSKIVSVSAKASGETFSVSANSTLRELMLVTANATTGNYEYSIVNMKGQLIQKGSRLMGSGVNSILLNQNFKPGIYVIHISNGSFQQQWKMML